MGVLFSLNPSQFDKYEFLNFALTWIPLEDLAKVDTSLCSHNIRHLFLSFISGMVFQGYRRDFKSGKVSLLEDFAVSYLDATPSISLLNWLKFRHLKVEHVFLTNSNIIYSFKTLMLGSLTSVCLTLSSQTNDSMISDNLITNFIKRSPNLTTINVSHGGLLLSEASLLRIIECYKLQLTTLVLCFYTEFSTKLVVLSISEKLKNITALHISASTIEDTDIEMLCLKCSTTLTSLNINLNGRLTAKGSCLAIANSLVNLKFISFSQEAVKTSVAMFRILRKRFKKIIRLDLLRHTAMGVSNGKLNLTESDVMYEMNHSRNLGYCSDLLNLNDKEFTPTCDAMEHISMPKFVVGVILDTFTFHCSEHLRVLNLQGNRSMTLERLDPSNDLLDSSLLILALKCKLLEYVNFSYRERITDVGMTCLFKSNRHLVSLFCVRCSCLGSGTIVALSEYCLQLEILNISYSSGDINDDCLIHLATGCPRLTHLGLQNLTRRITQITMQSMKSLVFNCKGIQNIQCSEPSMSYSTKKGGYYVRFFPAKIIPELDMFG